MSILSVVERVCLVIGIDKPTQLFSSPDREYQELARLANEIAWRIASVHDWQALTAVNTFTGDGSSEGFDLPSDYDRMSEASDIWSSRWLWSMTHVASRNTWLEHQVIPHSIVTGEWTIYGGQFHILPIMTAGETAKFFYVSNAIVTTAAGIDADAFSSDTDTFKLNENLLELGMIWQWRANKGLPYQEDMVNYEALLNRLMRRDGGSNGVVSGNSHPQRISRSRLAFPQTVGGS